MTIRIIITGGTFDKEYDELNGSLSLRDSHLPDMLKRGRSRLDLKVRTVMMIDSLDMTDEDREVIYQNCLKSEEKNILITHGTDTMVETAQYLAKRIKNKTIVLTGAMVPYVFGSSDGMFNLGSALAFVQNLPRGTYIAMNGKFFKENNVRKDTKTGYFEKIN
jgi:L-asparaginase